MMRGGRGFAAALRGIMALVTLATLIIGLPLALYRFGGDPVPRHLSGWHQISSVLLHRDNGTFFLGAVRDVSWIAWAAFTVAVIAEAQAALRGSRAPRLGLGALQNSAGWLVAAAALTFSGQSAATLLAVPAAAAAAVAATAPQQAAPPAARAPAAAVPPEPQVTNMAFYQLVTVRPGDCLWTIAQRYLGSGDRYPEIVKLNLGHTVAHGEVFTDPSVVWPGWVLQLPSGPTPGALFAGPHLPGSHSAHRVGDAAFGRPHHGAGSGRKPAHAQDQAHAGTGTASAGTGGDTTRKATPQGATPQGATPQGATPQGATPQGAVLPGPGSGSGAAQLPDVAHTVIANGGSTLAAEIPSVAVFAAGMLAGGASVLLAGMRHRQRQARRTGRRIQLPASAPVIVAEQRIRASAAPQPPTALRAALGELGISLLNSGRQIPDITGIRLLPSGLEVLLASPAIEPPPSPFTVPGGRQGMAWELSLPEHVPAFPFAPAEVGDLMPGLFTIGVDSAGGFLLLDPEYLRVTSAEGPPDLVDRMLTTAAAELATSQLAGWYDLMLVGFPELAAVGGRATSCGSLEEALDLLASKAVVLRRRLGDLGHADIRHRRLTQPGDEDWALALLVSRIPPTANQLALLLDLASDPGGIAALVAGGTDVPEGHPPPATVRLEDDPVQPGEIVARISPVGLDAWPQPLTEADYQALGSLFGTAADLRDIPAGLPPYDGPSWPPEPARAVLPDELPSWLDTGGPDDAAESAQCPGPGGAARSGGELAASSEPAAGGEPGRWR